MIKDWKLAARVLPQGKQQHEVSVGMFKNTRVSIDMEASKGRGGTNTEVTNMDRFLDRSGIICVTHCLFMESWLISCFVSSCTFLYSSEHLHRLVCVCSSLQMFPSCHVKVAAYLKSMFKSRHTHIRHVKSTRVFFVHFFLSILRF